MPGYVLIADVFAAILAFAGFTMAFRQSTVRRLIGRSPPVSSIAPADVDESRHAGESPLAYALRVATAKAAAGWHAASGRAPVLAADTAVARGDEHAASDIDLMVVGDVGLADLTPALRKAEARLGREVNATSYSAAEFHKKSAGKDPFLAEVLRGRKLFVKGDERDVDDLAGKPRRSTASDIEVRAR